MNYKDCGRCHVHQLLSDGNNKKNTLNQPGTAVSGSGNAKVYPEAFGMRKGGVVVVATDRKVTFSRKENELCGKVFLFCHNSTPTITAFGPTTIASTIITQRQLRLSPGKPLQPQVCQEVCTSGEEGGSLGERRRAKPRRACRAARWISRNSEGRGGT